MKKGMLILTTAIVCVSMSMPVFAATTPTTQENVQETYVEESGVLTDSMLQSMSVKDHEDCYDYLLKYVNDNPGLSSEELDEVAKNYYIQRYNNQGPRTRGWYDNLLLDVTGMNPEELALAKQYPSDVAAVYSSAKIANVQSASRYTWGQYLGNWDAFRHTAWNALLVCRFYALQKGDYNWCANRTRLWTTAHESGAPVNTSLSAAQRQADRDMDYLNNAAGREAAETTYTSEGAALNRVQSYVDQGLCKRIMTDAQINQHYSNSQMKAISTWTLKATSTAGKK